MIVPLFFLAWFIAGLTTAVILTKLGQLKEQDGSDKVGSFMMAIVLWPIVLLVILIVLVGIGLTNFIKWLEK